MHEASAANRAPDLKVRRPCAPTDCGAVVTGSDNGSGPQAPRSMAHKLAQMVVRWHLTFELSGRHRVGAWPVKRMMTLAGSRAKRQAGGGPLERRVRRHSAGHAPRWMRKWPSSDWGHQTSLVFLWINYLFHSGVYIFVHGRAMRTRSDHRVCVARGTQPGRSDSGRQ